MTKGFMQLVPEQFILKATKILNLSSLNLQDRFELASKMGL